MFFSHKLRSAKKSPYELFVEGNHPPVPQSISNDQEIEQMELPDSFSVLNIPEIANTDTFIQQARDILSNFEENREMHGIDMWIALVNAFSNSQSQIHWDTNEDQQQTL